MTTESLATSHQSVVLTTAQVNVSQTTDDESAVTSWSSFGVDRYFEVAVIVIGIVGVAANALILYALVSSKQHKKQVLIVNQNALDLLACLFLIVTYILKISNVSLTGLYGYWLCMMLLSENLLWFAIDGSMINLAVIAVERYLKIVHPIWSKGKKHKRVMYVAMALQWSSSFVYNMSLTFTTSAVIDGVCYGVVVWENHVAKIVHGVWHFLFFYAVILLVFIVCYWRILVTVRRQARVMAGPSNAGTSQPTAAQAQSNQIQSSITKTMIVVCAFYAVAWLPENTYYLLVELDVKLTFHESGYYAVVFISFLYICMNPFIYATRFDPVKLVLLSLIPCKKYEQPAADAVQIGTTTNRMVELRAAQECKVGPSCEKPGPNVNTEL